MEQEDVEILIKEAKRSWSVIQDELPEYSGFVKQSRLVLCCENGKQMELDEIDGTKLEGAVTVEVRFKSLCMAAIEAVKLHPLVNKDKTSLSPSSIRVVLV